ncbi:hypothetical protein [Chitinimonas naiadis]
MLYISRDNGGQIQSISREMRPGDEPADPDSPEVRRFLAQPEPAFDHLDAEFVRVIEDVIDTLIKNNVIKLTDLPAPAQRKLMARKGMRNKLQEALNLLGDDRMII